MKALTDEMIAEQIRQNNGMLVVLLIVIIFMMALLLLMQYGYRQSAKENDCKNKKLLRFNAKGLLIASVLLGIFGVFTVVAMFGAEENKDKWHLEYATVTEKKIEVDSSSDTQTKTYHLIYVKGYRRYIKVIEEVYDSIEIGERVYILVTGDNADSLWETDKYRYVGERLE